MREILIKVNSKKMLYDKVSSLIKSIIVKDDVARDEFVMSIMLSRGGKGAAILDLGFAEHRMEYVSHPNWFHRKLRDTFDTVFGVDYEEDLVETIRNITGYNNLYSYDVTEQFDLCRKFEVIHAGDLLEHVLNIRGFFDNVKKHLADNGKLYISTPNPQSYYYVRDLLFNGVSIPNSDHVVWIDPGNMYEVAMRSGFKVLNVYAPISPKRNIVRILEPFFPGAKRFMSGEYIYELSLINENQ